MAATIKIRRGTSTQWSVANPVLASGELGIDTTLNQFKIGDGATAWNSLSFSLAPINSPTFTGTPAAPTASAGTNTTQIATTAFVRTEVSNLVASAPAALDTLDELAAALGDDANFATTVTNSLSTKASLSGTETLTNKTLTSPRIDYGVVRGIEEDVNIVAAAATGTIDLDTLTASILFYTSNAIANHTLNIRGDGSSTLNSILLVGDSITVVWMNSNGTTPYYPNVIQIDGSAVTPKWQGGTEPSGGNASSIDVYTFTIIKTADTPTYTVLGSQTQFA